MRTSATRLLFTLAALAIPVFAQTATTTTLAITSGGNAVTSVTTGTVVTLTATVTAGSAPVTPGLVTFCDATAKYCEDIHIIGTAQLTAAGTATYKFRPSVANHSYKAVFAGSNTYAASTSAASTLSVGPLFPTTTTVQASVSSNTYELSAVVDGVELNPSIPGPTGEVSFLDTSNNNAVIGTATLGPATLGFNISNPAIPTTGANPWGIAIGDFNGDGIPDIATANSGSDSVTVLLGNGDGTFTAAPSLTTGASPKSIVSADFNGDGIPDLAVANYGSDTVTVFLGKGDGTFTAVSSTPATDSEPIAMAVADFNGDGIPDLAVSNYSGSTITILLGNGDGTFTATPSTISTGSATYPDGIVAADFNGDGIQDLAVASYLPGCVLVLEGHGDGTFTPFGSPITLVASPDDYATNIISADFNGDGIPDLFIPNAAGPAIVLLGQGNGNFTQATPPVGTGYVPGVAVADFNGDGIPDLVVTEEGDEAVIYLGKGDGTFTAWGQIAPIPVFGTPAVDTSDLTGDGFPDLVLTGPYSELLSVTLIQPGYGTETTETTLFSVQPGEHAIVASYPGDSNYAPSVSLPQTVQYHLPTTLTLSASPSSGLMAGQSTLLTATLSPSSYSGDSTNGETVNFYNFNFGAYIGAGTLSGGVATLTTPLSPGSENFTAIYGGDADFALSESNPVDFSVPLAQPSLALSVSPSSGVQGQTVTLTAAPNGNFGSVNGETITFLSNGQTIGTGTISSGTATLNLSTLPPGIDALTATYPGDSNNLPASSSTLQYAVARTGQTVTAVSLAVTSGGSSITSTPLGAPILLTATVTAGGAAVAPGRVMFCDTSNPGPCTGVTSLGSAQLNSQGAASFTVRLGVGSHPLQAIFMGKNTLAQGASNLSTLTLTGQIATTTTLRTQPVGADTGLSVDVSAIAARSAGNLAGNVDIEDQDDGNQSVFSGPLSTFAFFSPTFSASQASPATGTKPFSIATADLNHDGIPDLVVANSGDNNVGVLLGNGDGTFKAQATYSTGAGPFAVAIGDFNNDGNPDLAVTNLSSGGVSILLGNGDGTFQAQTIYAVGNGPSAISIGDFNGDGNLDLAVANNTDNTVSILLGNGDGTFQAQQTFPTGNSPDAVAAGDFNGDGYTDLVVANNTDGTVGVLLGEGNGSFEPMVPYAVGKGPVSIAVADFNADGNLDLAVANLSSNSVSLLFGNGDGTFKTQVILTSFSGPEAVIAGDFAGLGHADIAIANSVTNTVEVFVNQGSGYFASSAGPYATGKGPLSLAAADWNGDSLLDLAAVNNSGNSVTVVLNSSGPSAGNTAGLVPLPGKHTLVAQYSGNSNFSGSTSSPVQVDQSRKGTILSLGNPGGPDPSNYGQSVTLVATLTPTSDGPYTNDGESITFRSGNTVIGTDTLIAGVATLTLSTLPVGLDTITASFPADNYFTSSVGSFTQTVRPAVLTVTAANATRPYGAANPAFTGTVSGAVNGDTFTVTGTTTATAASAPDGYPIVPSATGANVFDYTVTAVNGTLTVTQAAATIALSASASQANASTPVTFTATLAASGSGAAPTGTVSFYDGTTLLGSGSLSAGAASYTTSSLSAGTHSITASYGGDANYISVTSSAFNEVIVSGSGFALSSSGSTSATVSPGGKATYSLAVNPPANATFPEAINFTVTGLPAGATATFNPSSIPAGAGATNVILTIALPSSAAMMPMKKPFQKWPLPLEAGLILLPVLAFRRMRRWNRPVGFIVLLATATFLGVALFGCGGGSSGSKPTSGSQTQPQNYTLTVTASSASATQTATLTLTVEQ